jgi:hypothetical protein
MIFYPGCLGGDRKEFTRMASTISAAARNDLRAFVMTFVQSHTQTDRLDEAETLAQEMQAIVGQAVLDASLETMTGKATYRGCSVACECKGKARFVGYRFRWVKSACGETKVQRAYYHCAKCKRGRFPWDEAQGLNERVWSPRLKATICQVAGRLPYSEATDLLRQLGVVTIEESSAEDVMLEVGDRLREKERAGVERLKTERECQMAERLHLDVSEKQPKPKSPARPVVGNRLYMACDATTAHIGGGWHNVNCGMVFTTTPDKTGKDHLNERNYISMQSDMETFGWQLRRLAEEWNVTDYAEQVFLGDGAPCNWNLAASQFPQARQILDFFHVSEHLGTLAHVLYNQNNPAEKARGDRWLNDHLDSLKENGPRPLLRALKQRSGKGSVEQNEAVRQMHGYVIHNAYRMDYPCYIKDGMLIGSGPIEAACKVIVGQRLKLSGMRWSKPGADTVLAVRTTIMNRNITELNMCARAA